MFRKCDRFFCKTKLKEERDNGGASPEQKTENAEQHAESSPLATYQDELPVNRSTSGVIVDVENVVERYPDHPNSP